MLWPRSARRLRRRERSTVQPFTSTSLISGRHHFHLTVLFLCCSSVIRCSAIPASLLENSINSEGGVDNPITIGGTYERILVDEVEDSIKDEDHILEGNDKDNVDDDSVTEAVVDDHLENEDDEVKDVSSMTGGDTTVQSPNLSPKVVDKSSKSPGKDKEQHSISEEQVDNDSEKKNSGHTVANKSTTPRWPDDDDDVAPPVKNVHENVNDKHDGVITNNSRPTVLTTSKKSPTGDDDDAFTTESASAKMTNVGGGSNIKSNDMMDELQSQSTANHRTNQSKEEEDGIVDENKNDTSVTEDLESTADVTETRNNADEVAGTETEMTGVGNENAQIIPEKEIDTTDTEDDEKHETPATNTTPDDSKSNNVPFDNPNESIPPSPEHPEQPPIQDWIDEDEDSFFDLVQSTFHVILLAVGLTSFFVLRQRVRDRVRADPSVSLSSAVKDEVVDVVSRVVSWATSASNGTRDNSNYAQVGNDESSGYGNSRVGETIPTATDEEWGWDDEDMGTRLELSAMQGDEAKDDEDLALAIAMSISDSRNGSDDASTTSVLKPPSSKNVSKFSPPSNKDKIIRSSTARSTNTSTESLSYSSGGDSISDLLGQMGGTGGPRITSFGQKSSTTTTIAKPKPIPKEENADDIFASMGLIPAYSSTAGSKATTRPPPPTTSIAQSKINAPTSSAPISSLLDDAYDDTADADTWGDDGDLDDLLDA